MLLVTALLLAGTSAAQLPGKPGKPYYDLNDAGNLFREFLQKHGKAYDPEEYLTRLDIFKGNLKDINERNALHPHTEFGVTRFTDLTPEERRHYLGLKSIDHSVKRLARRVEYPAEAITAPDEFDWRENYAVTPVKDQGHCGANWVFSATGNIEGQYAIKHKQCISLSAQQALDCVDVNGQLCLGGWPHNVLAYYHFVYGIGFDTVGVGVASEDEYPYIGKSLPYPSCKMQNNLHPVPITNVTGFEVLEFDGEESLKQFLYETGPLAVGLNSYGMFEYIKGISYPHYCNDPLDATLLLVGYGIENGVKYWILKNSWGTEWGENGYYRLVRGKEACNMGIWYTTTCTVD